MRGLRPRAPHAAMLEVKARRPVRAVTPEQQVQNDSFRDATSLRGGGTSSRVPLHDVNTGSAPRRIAP